MFPRFTFHKMSITPKNTMSRLTASLQINPRLQSHSTNWRCFLCFYCSEAEWWQVFYQTNDKNLKMPFSRMQSRASCVLLMQHSALMSLCLCTLFQVLIYLFSSHLSCFFFSTNGFFLHKLFLKDPYISFLSFPKFFRGMTLQTFTEKEFCLISYTEIYT